MAVLEIINILKYTFNNSLSFEYNDINVCNSLRIMVSVCPVQVLPSFMNEKLTWGNRVLDVAICRFLYTQLLHIGR